MSNIADPERSQGCPLHPWAYSDSETFRNAAKLHAVPDEELIAASATRGRAADELHLNVVALHRDMRARYLEVIHQVGRNIYPLIIARDNLPDRDRADWGRQGLGGTYTLYLEGGETHSVRPTPRAYELLKCLAHIPLGLFTIVSPYFQNPRASAWAAALEGMGAQIDAALASLAAEEQALADEHRAWVRAMLERSRGYVRATLAARSISPAAYEAYTAEVRPLIVQCMDEAARIQMRATIDALLRWREMLGPALWRSIYAVVPTVWPVSERSPRWQALRSVMDPDRVDTHIIVGEGVMDEEQARTLLGRVVADRLAGRMVFGIDSERGRRMTQCLSSPTDVVSDSARAALEQLGLRAE